MPRTPITDRDQMEVRDLLATKDYRTVRNLLYTPDVFIAIDERSTYIVEYLCDLPHVPNRDISDGNIHLCSNCHKRPTAPNAQFCETCMRSHAEEAMHS